MTDSNIDLFASDKGATGGSSDNGNVDYLAELVGEGKRYKDVNALAKAAKDKDDFIERLKAEAAAARSALRGEQKIDELLDKLKNVNAAAGSSSNQNTNSGENNSNQPPNNENPTQKGLTPAEVEEILERREAQKAAERNLKESLELVKSAFGANFGEVLSDKAQELGMSKDELTKMASTSPAAFARLVGADRKRDDVTLPRTQVNSAALRDPKTGNVKNSAYYKKLRKDIGDAEFFKPEIQNEIFRQVKALGDAF